MVKALFLGLLAATMCGLVRTAPAPQLARQEGSPPPAEEDAAVARSERSTSLATARKIQMFIKNRHLQILPGGIVNGTTDDASEYTILQRTSVGIGQMKIQGVATCQYLCMDSCGLLYGSRDFGDECVFNETIEQHNYNTYSSTKYSNERRTLYLALNRRGQPRKVLLRAHQQLGRLSSYTRVLTRTVSSERVEELFHPMRHRAHVCSSAMTAGGGGETREEQLTEHPRCRRRKKKKKKKRKCQDGADADVNSDLCHKRQQGSRKVPNRIVCDSSDECQRVEVTMKKKQHSKTKHSDNTHVLSSGFKKKKSKKQIKKRLRVSTSTEVADVATDEDEDYAVDVTTAWDWEDTTSLPLMPDETGTTHPD